MVALVYLIIYDHKQLNHPFFHILFAVTIWSIYFKWTVQIKGMASSPSPLMAQKLIGSKVLNDKWINHGKVNLLYLFIIFHVNPYTTCKQIRTKEQDNHKDTLEKI